MGVVASAPAKVILFGEHFVVYGEPAIVLAIDRRAYATVDRRDEKHIHLQSADLGFAGHFENGNFKVEKGDARDAGLRFEAIKLAVEKVMSKCGEKAGLNIEIKSSVVAAGLGSSAAVIAAVTTVARALTENYPSLFEPLRKAAREIVLRLIDAFEESDVATVGELMNINQALLYAIGVSDESLEWLINASRKAGALGAKLTRAGGGGCMVALTKNEHLERVLDAIVRAGGKPFIARKTDEGVKVEQT